MTQQEVIRKFNHSLDTTTVSGRAALDEAVKASSDFTSYQEVVNKFLEDQKASPNWHRFLVEKCGIVLDNSDTGAISGADAGNGTVKTKTDIIPCEGDAEYPSGTSFTVDGLTIYGIPNKSRLTAAQQYVVQGLYSWWIRDSLLLIKESYGYSYTDTNTTNARLKLKFINDSDGDHKNILAYVNFDSEDSKEWESRVLCVNMAWFNDADLTDRHGTTATGTQLDRTLVHELVHGLMASNVNYCYDLPRFLAEGGTAELIHGIDDERRYDLIVSAKDSETFQKILNPTFTDGLYEVYPGGYIFMRYFAKQAAGYQSEYDTYNENVTVDDTNFATNYWDSVTMTGTDDADTLTNSGANVYISAGGASNVVKNYGAQVSIAGGSDYDSITNTGAQTYIDAGEGDDTVANQSTQSTIVGGAGVDSISNFGANSSVSGGDGDDILVNTVSEYETLDVVSYTLTESGIMSGNDAVVLIANGNSTLKAYTAELLGGNNATLRGGDGDDEIENYANKARVYGDAGYDFMSNFGVQASVYGGAGDDSIVNGAGSVAIDVSGLVDSNLKNVAYVEGFKARLYGGDGNDSIVNECNEVRAYGQNDADVITNSGTNTSVYGGAGNDTIDNNGKESYISADDGDDEISNYVNAVKAYGGAGNDFFLNDAEQVTLSGDAGNDQFLNYGDFNSLSGGAGDDTIYSSGEATTLNGGSGNDYIENEGVKAYIAGSNGNDTIVNSGEHITISGGKGDDAIVNSGRYVLYRFNGSCGNDTVQGFNEGDTIQLTSGTYTATTSGNDVLFQVGNASMTLTDTAGKTFYVYTADGATDTISFDPTVLTLTDDDAAKQTLGAGFTYLNAMDRTKATRVVGNALNNIIFGGSGKDTIYGQDGDDTISGNDGNDRLSGQNGNDILYGGDGNDSLSGGTGMDTLWGGAGNDTLTGGAGVDTFVYTPNEGNDVITDYQSGELVSIDDGGFTDAAFATNKLTLTIDGGGSLTFNNVTTSTVFNINDNFFHVNGDTIK